MPAVLTSLLFAGLLIAYAVSEIATKRGRVFYVDAVVWSLVWGVLFGLNGVFGGPYIQSAITNTLMFLFVCCFLLGNKIPIAKTQLQSDAIPDLQLPGVLIFVIVCSVVGMAAPYELLTHGGASLGGVDSYGDLASSIGGELKTGVIEQSIFGKIAFAAPQAAVVVAGIAATLSIFTVRRRLLMIALAVAPLVTYTIISTLRSSTLVAVFLLGSGIIAGFCPTGRERSIFRGKSALLIFATVFLLALMSIFFQSIRLKDYGFSEVGKTVEHMRIWVAGVIPGFNGWLWHTWSGHLTYGATMFRFLAGLITGKSSFIENVATDIYLGDYSYGNACTTLRPIINDFGLLGCAVFLFFWGLTSRWMLTKAREGKPAYMILFACNLAAVIFSANGWWFNYGSRWLAPVIALLYLFISRLKLRRSANLSAFPIPSPEDVSGIPIHAGVAAD